MNIAKNPYFFKFLFITLLIFLSSGSYSQKFINLKTYNVDSLLAILPDQVGEGRVNTLNNLAASLFFIDGDEGTRYAEEALILAKELDYKEGIASAHYNFVCINLYQGDYPEALKNGFDMLAIYQRLDDKHKTANTYYVIAWIHHFANNYEKTIEYLYISLELFSERSKEGNTVGVVRDFTNIYGSLAENYAWLGIHERSLEFNSKTLRLMKKNNYKNIELMATAFLRAVFFQALGELDSAKVHYFKSLDYLGEDQNTRTFQYRTIHDLGWVYYDEGDIDSAIYCFQTAFEFYKKNGFLFWAEISSRGLGYIYYKMNELEKAEKYLKQSESIFNEMLTRNSWYRYDSLRYIVSWGWEMYFPWPPGRMKELMWADGISIYRLLYRINAVLNRSSEALKYHIAYSDAKDTLNKLERDRETIELLTRYESERKDQQIATLSLENELKESRLQQNRYFLFGVAGLLILILMFGFILLRQNKLKTDQQVLVLQQKLFRSQMNPHFIFNSLASIQNFIVKQDSRKANIYLSRFSELVRSILDNSAQEFVTYEKEINTIRNYLELQRVRYNDKFNYSIDIDQAIDTESMRIPPMLAQPFIENAIEHGIKHKQTKGHIMVRFTQDVGLLTLVVEDDGVGREKAREILLKQDKDHKSLATALTRERIAALNHRLKKKITLEIIDLKDQKGEARGTLVRFGIPV